MERLAPSYSIRLTSVERVMLDELLVLEMCWKKQL